MPLRSAQASMISATTRDNGDCAGTPRSLTISSAPKARTDASLSRT